MLSSIITQVFGEPIDTSQRPNRKTGKVAPSIMSVSGMIPQSDGSPPIYGLFPRRN